MENFNNVLTSLEGLNKTFDIFVPSLNRKIKFKGLTTKQQKEAVKTALDKAFSGISFSNLTNTIINENSTEKVEFNILDRNYILVVLRALSLSSTVISEEGTLDISFVANNNFTIPENLKNRELEDGNLKINVTLPSLAQDSFINQETKKKLSPLADNDNLPSEAVGEMYVNELVKYINKIVINDGTKPVEVEFNQLTFSQRVKLVENLPLSANTKLVNFINEVKQFEKKYFVQNDKEVEIDIDPSLFTV